MKFILFIVLLIIFGLLIGFGLYNYSTRNTSSIDKDSYSFLNQFPYELTSDETTKYHFIVKILSSLFGAAYASYGAYIFYTLNMYGAKTMHDYILGSIFLITGIVLFLSFVWSLKDYKKHLISASLLFGLTVVEYLYVGLFVLLDPRNTYHSSLMYIMFIAGGLMLILLLVIPLKKWLYLEKHEKDGIVTYHRQKIALLPSVEWLFILLNMILALILVIY